MASIDYNGPGPPKGFLVPPWYQEQKPSLEEMNIISIIWGFSLACAGFTFVKAIRQTWCCLYRWHRRRRHEQQRQQEQEQVHGQESRGQLRRVTSKRSSTGQSYYTRPTRVLILNGYLAMVWAEWLVSVAFGILSWFYLNPNLVVRGSFWVFFGFLCLWTVQMQCILQILVNRVSLLLLTGSDRRCASRLKWGVAAFVGVINISPEWIKANKIWDRTEKAFFAIADIALNLLFLYLVRTKLIGNGLQKYRRLFWTNSVAVFFSVSLDVILIGVMSLQDDAVYLQFHPLVYLLKLHIEMNLAELLAKIVRASNKLNDCDSGGTNSGGSGAWASGQQMKQAVAIDFDIYSDRSNTTADGGGSVLGPCTTSGTTGSALPSYPPGVRRTNSNSHNNHGLDMELDLNIAPDECYDDRCGIHRLSRSWGKGSTEEDRSIMNEARRLGVGTNMDTNLRGGGRPSVERHSSSSVLMKVSSEDS
ncbi:uncharacterized protein PG998_005183 [Apiospora kogelbergensis]|uniref:uncharacterized protein n=1 Tax=Apiospora kogelbergensis TaxID=1337665 RepID=UPI00312EED28